MSASTVRLKRVGCFGILMMSFAMLSIPCEAQIPGVQIPQIPGGNPFGSILELKDKEPISTNFADAKNEIVLPDSFSPNDFKPLFGSPTAPGGAFLLAPGAYEAHLQSFCLHAGTHGPSQGDGYLYAPLKGSKAAIIRSLLQRTAQHPEIPQTQVQMLIWSIEARSKFSDLPLTLQHAALTLLTSKEIYDLNGGALGLIPQSALDRAMNSLPPNERQIFAMQAQLRSKLASGSATFAEIESIAVLPGPAAPDGPIIPRGRWSAHPGGFFVRYLPEGYQHTVVQVYVPDSGTSTLASSNLSRHAPALLLVNDVAASGPRTVQYDPTLDVAVPANTGAQRLGLSGAEIPSDTTSNPPGPVPAGHHKVNVPCPGSHSNVITIAGPAQSALGFHNLANTGSCSLSIQALDATGKPLAPNPNTSTSTLVLQPGQSIGKWVPPPGTVKVIVACFTNCPGTSSTSFEYDDNIGVS
ncbi:MAG: hypothetical protein V4587_03900 [Acidobacteriota bacterium]